MSPTHADLEIALRRLDAYRYSVDLRYTPPGGQTDDWVSGESRFDLTALRAAALDDAEYGRRLATMLLSDEKVRARFVGARREVEAADADLRLRLLIDQSAPELHTLSWERLAEPDSDTPLVTRQWIHFSRYLANADWRPVRPHPESRLKTLIVVANPTNLEEWGLASIPVAFELRGATQGLLGNEVSRLTAAEESTLARIIEALRSGIDILYLVCHGAFNADTGRPLLYLSNKDGEVDAVDGIEFAHQLEDLTVRPRLIVLVSCHSGGSAANEAEIFEAQLGALGPRLARAGIPAVVAMHGSISMNAAADFIPKLLMELQKDGRVDRAMAHARSAIQADTDWWKPVLFLRLRNGRLSYRPHLTGKAEEVESQWRTLLNNIANKRCTPILGPGLTEHLVGGRREVARRWAQLENVSLPAEERENLTQVAQFLATDRDPNYPKDQFPRQIKQNIRERYEADLESAICELAGRDLAPGELAARIQRTPVDEQIRLLARQRMQSDDAEPHLVLARLPLPIFVTAGFSNLMAEALTIAGKRPRVEMFRWKDTEVSEDWGPRPSLEGWEPSVDEPLVFHLFGRLEIPESLVLTEDDYFDYLLHLDRKDQALPPLIGKSLSRSLLLLGFRSEDWGFRVLFRSVMEREGKNLRNSHAHIAVQVEPEESPLSNPDRMRAYFAKYLARFRVSMFVGRVEDFSGELRRRMEAADALEATR